MSRIVDLSQDLEDRARVDRDRTGLYVTVDEIEHERLDVAVKDYADHFAVAVDDGTARVAANDVRSADEIERRLGIDLVFVLEPAFRQFEGRHTAVLLGVLERSAHRG